MSRPGATEPAQRHARAIALDEADVGGAWNVQGDGERAAFLAEVERWFPVDLPRTPNTSARRAALAAFWLGPKSWLVVRESALSLDDFLAARDALNAAGGALFDVSASRVAFRVRGSRAPDVLAAGCPLDFGDRAFPAGSCRQSLLFRVAALIERNDDAPSYTAYVARSLAAGVRKALAVAAAEYGYEPRDGPAPG
jgi:sarcosine oxidase subunit gamma